jgi:hypothetical protein
MRTILLSLGLVGSALSCGSPAPTPGVDGGLGGIPGTVGGAGGSGGMTMSPPDGGNGCIRFNELVYMPPATEESGGFGVNQQGVGVNSWGIVSRTEGTMPVNVTVEGFLFNRQPAVSPMLPVTGMFTGNTNGVQVFARSFFGIDCSAMGTNCLLDYASVSGTYSITQATNSPDAGRFDGTFTNVRYERIDLSTFSLVPDGGCVEIPSVRFSTRW